ncbi:hypothetical protein C8C83_2256 [Flavobacterium sp. 90]|uniref:hypothetical protein n=1 Tax=unclassified Flavobacterium TaxID=196869 RepID=UPI000EB584BF|nr:MULTISPECIES: hypothetical protein [unclassified Flavobacterium]RKR10579.1 hypothetical protein C8C82_2560 [Flavobacterium sp. 81]TCK54363.1 hypothetical protein C8C83_2256 [Flavobacterium sp. 90]
MNELIIESKGIKTNRYFIPPFELRKGELILIHLDNHIDSIDIEDKMIALFTGKVKHENVIVHKSLTYVEHFRESKFRNKYFPMTVGEYLFRNINRKNKFAKKIYETAWINKNIKINTLAGNPRRLLTLYSVLSKTNNIIFDLAAQDFQGMEHAAEIVKEEIKNDGSAILIQWGNHLKERCTKYIRAERIPFSK